LVTNFLSAESAPNAAVYALGHETRFQGETTSGADIVVSGVGFPVTSPNLLDPKASINFQVQSIDGEWRITRIDRAATDLVPDFFDWYAPWSEVFPAY
jgi:hypothetical protein